MGPQILKRELWERSGHWDNYRENMYFTEVEGQAYGIKPMNCLAHMLIYKSKVRSYRDLPKRYFELGTVLRHERSGVLHGLPRVRQFTQDDAHIICTPEQLNDEIKAKSWIVYRNPTPEKIFDLDPHILWKEVPPSAVSIAIIS